MGREEIQILSATKDTGIEIPRRDIETQTEVVRTLAQWNARSVCLMEAV
jgi:hypothetical protein